MKIIKNKKSLKKLLVDSIDVDSDGHSFTSNEILYDNAPEGVSRESLEKSKQYIDEYTQLTLEATSAKLSKHKNPLELLTTKEPTIGFGLVGDDLVEHVMVETNESWEVRSRRHDTFQLNNDMKKYTDNIKDLLNKETENQK